MIYSHTYTVTSCPECGADLTTENAITFTANNQQHESQLDTDGTLIDLDCLIAEGKHQGTECTSCGAYLDEFESV